MTCGEGGIPPLPFSPFDLHVIWFKVWRGHIASAKNEPNANDGYCRLACLAQMQYITELALKVHKLRRQINGNR